MGCYFKLYLPQKVALSLERKYGDFLPPKHNDIQDDNFRKKK